MPPIVAVPSPLSWKCNPAGSEPDSWIVAVGSPVVRIVKVPDVPTVRNTVLALVIDGGTWAGVRVSVSVAELLPGVGSVTPAGAVTVAVFDRLPVALVLIVALSL